MIVFGKEDCQGCSLTTKMLDSMDLDYEYQDVTLSRDAMDMVTSLGYRQLPVVYVNEDYHFYGFRPDLLRDLQP